MFETFFMKYKEPVKYGIIKAMQFSLMASWRKPQTPYCPYDVTIKPGGYVKPTETFSAPKIENYPPLVEKKKKDPTKDYNWPAAVKSNGGLRGSKATSHRRFR